MSITVRKTLLIITSISVSLFGWLRFAGALQILDYLLQLGLYPHPFYYLISGLVIGITFLLAIIAVTLNCHWAPIYIRVCGLGFIIHLIIENLSLHRWVNITQMFFVTAATGLLFLLTMNKPDKNHA